ncbi:hypothetical protein Peur_040636 [Populus x canadensis]
MGLKEGGFELKVYLRSCKLWLRLPRFAKELSAVEMELAAARQAGFVSKKLVEKGDKHSKKRILAVNDALGATLFSSHLDKPGGYIRCMQSGEVFSEPTLRWYDPDWWKFGDVKLSIFRKYAHDDVSTGSWFIGLQVKHVDESKFCCSS